MLDDPQLLMTFFIALVGGSGIVGIITAISSHLLGKTKQKMDMSVVINDGFNALLLQQRNENDRLLARFIVLEDTVDNLETRIKQLEEYIKSKGLSVPEWKNND